MSTLEGLVAVESLESALAVPEASRVEWITEEVVDDGETIEAKREIFRHGSVSLHEGRVTLSVGLARLELGQPTEAGSYALRDLGGLLCEPSSDRCIPVDGAITVDETSVPKARGDFATFVAKLSVPEPSPLPPGPVVYGNARIRHRESPRQVCVEVARGGGGIPAPGKGIGST